MGRHCFVYTENARLQEEQPTMIHYKFFVKIGDNYYQVIGEPTFPRPFQVTGENRRLRGWKFYAMDVTDEKVINLLNTRKAVYLELHPDSVEEDLEAYL